MDCPQWLKKLEIKQLVNKNAFTQRTIPELAPKSFNQLSKDIIAMKVNRDHPIIIDAQDGNLIFKN